MKTISAVVFLWAVFGSLVWTWAAGWLGGYDCMISSIVRSWCQRWPILRAFGFCLFLWLAFHLFVEDLVFCKQPPDIQLISVDNQAKE